jgi:hypothetical protein
MLVGLAPIRWVGAEEFGARSTSAKRHLVRVGYLLWHQGETTSRGSIDALDLEAARSLGVPEDADRFYFRIGERSWISEDPAVIAAVRKALADEDRYERDQRPHNERRMTLDRENQRLLSEYQDLDPRERELDARREKLEARRAALAEQGRSTRELRAERDALDQEREALGRERRRLENQMQDLTDELTAIYNVEKASWVERDRIHDQSMRDIERIGKKAVEEGRARVFRD